MNAATPRVLVLAAGQSRRFGDDKRRAPLTTDRQTLLARGAGSENSGSEASGLESPPTTLLEATLSCFASLGWPIQAALRGNDDRLSLELTQQSTRLGLDRWLTPLQVADAELGLGHTLAAGVRHAMSDGVTHLLVALGDMPYLRRETLSELADALLALPAEGLAVVRPRSHRGPGNPVGFTQPAFPELMGLEGDRGARELLERWQPQTRWVPVDDDGIHRDVDRPGDLSPR